MIQDREKHKEYCKKYRDSHKEEMVAYNRQYRAFKRTIGLKANQRKGDMNKDAL